MSDSNLIPRFQIRVETVTYGWQTVESCRGPDYGAKRLQYWIKRMGGKNVVTMYEACGHQIWKQLMRYDPKTKATIIAGE